MCAGEWCRGPDTLNKAHIRAEQANMVPHASPPPPTIPMTGATQKALGSQLGCLYELRALQYEPFQLGSILRPPTWKASLNSDAPRNAPGARTALIGFGRCCLRSSAAFWRVAGNSWQVSLSGRAKRKPRQKSRLAGAASTNQAQGFRR